MNRRGFLSLLVVAPLVPALAKLERLATVLDAPPAEALIAPEIEYVTRHLIALSTRLSVPAGRIERIEIMPQRPFLPDCLIVAAQSECFDILNVSAAGEPTLADSVPASLFSSRQDRARFCFSPIMPAETIVLAVLNRGRAPAHFVAQFHGQLAVYKNDARPS